MLGGIGGLSVKGAVTILAALGLMLLFGHRLKQFTLRLVDSTAAAQGCARLASLDHTELL